jgi:hypothetical protein
LIAVFVIAGLIVFGGVFSSMGMWFPTYSTPFSFSIGTAVGSGHATTVQENYSSFNTVSIASGFAFTITQSNTYSVQITIDDNLVKDVTIVHFGNSLSVGLSPWQGYSATSLKVVITMPDITSLDISGGSTGTVSGFTSTHGFTIDASGGSVVTVSGTAGSLTVNESGGSHLDLSGLQVTDATVNLSGGSWTTVNPSGRLDANISGGSQLYYVGSPVLGSINSSGGSIVSKR